MLEADSLSSDRHGDAVHTAAAAAGGGGGGDDAVTGEEAMDLSESPFLFASSPPELDEEETHQSDDGWSQDGDLQGCGQLERRWILWHEFMKEHAHLDAWLRSAERAVGSPNSARVTYVTAKEELRKFKRLRCEAGSRLVQLDSLTRRNRTLTRMFQGVMQARVLAATRECGARWDDVNAKLESITGRLKLFVSEWEGFEVEREDLALLLADLDFRLTEVEHLTGNTCEKLRRLQSFQQCVCVNSGRINVLLQRGEALIQSSEPTDAQYVEGQLLELLRCCSHVYNNIARTHTRLLSMRLVFEDDWILSRATDSGCPSETLLEEEGALDRPNLDLPVMSNHPEDFSQSANPCLAFSSDSPSSLRLAPPPPPSPSSPSHEHMGLEWDPSVDIGRSVSHDDADSSYFSASTGLCNRDGLKRRSYISSLGSQSDISNDIINHEADLQRRERWRDRGQPGLFWSVTAEERGARLSEDQWATSTPDRRGSEPVGFDGGRVRAWLGVQSPAPPDGETSSCKAVQTDGEMKYYLDESHVNEPNQPRPHVVDSQSHHDNTQKPFLVPSPSPSRDLKAAPDWTWHQYQSNLQAEEESSRCEEAERLLLSEQSVTPSTRAPALLYLLLAAALALLACLVWAFLEPPCHRSSRMPRSLHLALRYVNGPPPT